MLFYEIENKAFSKLHTLCGPSSYFLFNVFLLTVFENLPFKYLIYSPGLKNPK